MRMSWGGYLLKDSELFILFAEDSQILLKISVILILLTFIYLVALYLLVNNQLNSSSNSNSPLRHIIVTLVLFSTSLFLTLVILAIAGVTWAVLNTYLIKEPLSVGSEHRLQTQSKYHSSLIFFRLLKFPYKAERYCTEISIPMGIKHLALTYIILVCGSKVYLALQMQ